MRTILSTLLLLALLTTHLEAHGGQYKGPADAGGSGPVSKGNKNDPTDPGGYAGAGPGNPYGGGGLGSSPTGGYVRGESIRGNDPRSSGTGGGYEAEDSYEVWEFWWENNKDRFLNLKGRLERTSSVSGSPNLLTGRGNYTASTSTRRPSADMLRTEVIPYLVRMLRSLKDRDMLDSAVMALSRVASDQDALDVVDVILPLLAHKELSVQAAAALALGVYGSSEATPMLRDLLSDASAGRQLLGGGEVPWLVRSFAALSLGLVGDADAVSSLTSAVGRLDDSDRNIKVCAIVGLSLVQDEKLRALAAASLEPRLQERNLDALIKSYIPTTLGKLGQASSLEPVLAVYLDRDTHNLVRQSAGIALGRLATIEDKAVVRALIDSIDGANDMQTRHFAFISLAKIGARDPERAAHAQTHADIKALLTREITKPDRRTNRPWAALAAALYGRAHLEDQPDIIDRLVDGYEKERDPSTKAAFALALGLLDARAAADMIQSDFMASKDNDFRGYAAVALGFLKHRASAPALRSCIQDKSTPPTFRLQAATGLGLMADPEAVTQLVATLESAQTLGVSSAVARALGLIGDRSAVAPLLALASNESKSELARAFAAVALGIVGEKTDLPWNAVIGEDNNYRARVPAMDEVLDIL